MLACALWVLAFGGCRSEATPPRIVAAFVDAAHRGQAEIAYGMLASSYRARVSLAAFREGIERQVYLVEARGFRVTRVSVAGERTEVDGIVDSGGDVPVTAVLVREGERWLLLELRAPAEPLLP